ncbi:hypothetical protein FHT39_002271 [Mitsuaria sp. BK045]|nr:hypothetical protein [Mitsuaria sp. BK041]MBB3362849.1 hypothetical protein [Mitsuaria sp. BK045]
MPRRVRPGAGRQPASIAEAHGWTLSAEPEDPGLRLVVTRAGPALP